MSQLYTRLNELRNPRFPSIHDASSGQCLTGLLLCPPPKHQLHKHSGVVLGFSQFPCTAGVDLVEAVPGAGPDLPIIPGPEAEDAVCTALTHPQNHSWGNLVMNDRLVLSPHSPPQHSITGWGVLSFKGRVYLTPSENQSHKR